MKRDGSGTLGNISDGSHAVVFGACTRDACFARQSYANWSKTTAINQTRNYEGDWRMRLVLSCCLAMTTAIVSAFAGQAIGNEITIKGMVLNNVHTGEKEKSVFVYALDGTPEIRAEVDRIIAEYYPDKGLDGDAARTLQDQFTARLKYFITGPHAEELHEKATYGARQLTALTGTVTEKDGKKWITVSKYADTTLQYPAKMLAPDKPLVMPERPPLVLKINDRLSLKCIWVPPGKFFMGEPYYQCPHWQEAPPHTSDAHQGFLYGRAPDHAGDVRGSRGQQSQQGESGQGFR